MQFRIKALLLATIVVALLFRLVMSLKNSTYFYLIPVAIAGIAYVFGNFLRRPITVAILAVRIFGLYGLTMPLIEQYGSATRWPSGTFRLFEHSLRQASAISRLALYVREVTLQKTVHVLKVRYRKSV